MQGAEEVDLIAGEAAIDVVDARRGDNGMCPAGGKIKQPQVPLIKADQFPKQEVTAIFADRITVQSASLTRQQLPQLAGTDFELPQSGFTPLVARLCVVQQGIIRRQAADHRGIAATGCCEPQQLSRLQIKAVEVIVFVALYVLHDNQETPPVVKQKPTHRLAEVGQLKHRSPAQIHVENTVHPPVTLEEIDGAVIGCKGKLAKRAGLEKAIKRKLGC